MGVDASIPLDVNTQGIDVGKLMSMAQFAHQIRQEQRSEQTNNALRQIMLSPDAIDPKTSSITPNALKKIMQVDPETGIKLQGQELEQQMKMAQTKHYESENGKLSFDAMTGIAGAAYDAYDQAKKTGASEADARQAGIKVRNSGVQNNGGLISDADADKLVNSPFEPDQAKAFAGLNKEWSGVRSKQTEDTERDRHDLAMEGVAGKRADATTANKWQVLTDPKKNTQYRYNPETGEATSLDAKTPYSPGGAAKIGGGMAGRSAATMAVNKYMQEHPDATAEDIQQFAAQTSKIIKAETSFGTGKQGDMARSFNVAISHLNTLDGLIDAMGTGDVKQLNRLKTGYEEQFGHPAPTSFDAAKSIVGDEIIKAIIGGGGALADRENAQNKISRAESPAQLRGVISTYKDLMGGQLKGLRQQYETSTGRKDFDTLLSPETKAEAGSKGGAKAAPPSVKNSGDYEKLKPGDHYLAPDGKEYIKK